MHSSKPSVYRYDHIKYIFFYNCMPKYSYVFSLYSGSHYKRCMHTSVAMIAWIQIATKNQKNQAKCISIYITL